MTITDLGYLWHHRERPRNIKRWATVWAKRGLLAWPLLKILIRKVALTRHGASIGHLTVLEHVHITGSRKNLFIGRECSLGSCFIMTHDKVQIGNRVVINDNVSLLTGTHDLSDPLWSLNTSPIVIQDYAWIARGATILPGVTIGKGAVVGAGAVVRKDVPSFTVVTGNPATPSKTERANNLNYSPARFMAPYEAWLGKAYLEPAGSSH